MYVCTFVHKCTRGLFCTEAYITIRLTLTRSLTHSLNNEKEIQKLIFVTIKIKYRYIVSFSFLFLLDMMLAVTLREIQGTH